MVFLATHPGHAAHDARARRFLGIVLLRRGLAAPALAAGADLPAGVRDLMVTSLGSVVLPIAFAFGILGRRIAREHTTYAVAPIMQSDDGPRPSRSQPR